MFYRWNTVFNLTHFALLMAQIQAELTTILFQINLSQFNKNIFPFFQIMQSSLLFQNSMLLLINPIIILKMYKKPSCFLYFFTLPILVFIEGAFLYLNLIADPYSINYYPFIAPVFGICTWFFCYLLSDYLTNSFFLLISEQPGEVKEFYKASKIATWLVNFMEFLKC